MTDQTDSFRLRDSRRQLIEDGYCVVPQVIDPHMVQRLREATAEMTAAMSEEDKALNRSTGSMIPVSTHPLLGELITHPAVHAMLDDLGFSDCRFSSGYVISKPPHTPQLFWHFDWACWHHPFSYGDFPAQIFLMLYLVETTPENGCLRVLPRSHAQENSLHAILRQPHSQELSRANDISAVEYQTRPDAVDVCVRPGDLVIGDSRLIHGSHANDSDTRRTVITLWFHPNFEEYPDPIRGYVASLQNRRGVEDWPAELQQRLAVLDPVYDGAEPPLKFSRERLSREEYFAAAAGGDQG